VSFLLGECVDALAVILEVAKCRSAMRPYLSRSSFKFFSLVSSCTGQLHPTPFPVNAHYASEHFLLQRAVFQQPARTEFCKEAHTLSFLSTRLGAARRQDRGCQVCVILIAALLLTMYILSCRPTGWHGEGGAGSDGHITVDFCSLSNEHIVTHHVYSSDDAYRGLRRRVRRTHNWGY
jgi:hypothetical protein